MTKLTLTAWLTFLALSAQAEVQPSVWEQLQTGSGTTVVGQVKGLDIRGTSVKVTISKGKDQPPTSETLNLCSVEADRFRSEEERAVFFQQRVETLREARKSGETVRLSYRGPWQPCLVSVAVGSE